MTIDPNNKIILTDIDGVVLDFISNFYDYLEAEHNIKTTHEERMHQGFLHSIGFTDKDHLELFIRYHHSDFFRDLPPFECAVEKINELSDDGWQFVAITSCHSGDERQSMEITRNSRQDNLDRHFKGVFKELHIADWQNGKSAFLKAYKPTWWIDDRVKHANIGHDLGHQSIIMESPDLVNMTNDYDLPVAKTWHDIEQMIKDYNEQNKVA